MYTQHEWGQQGCTVVALIKHLHTVCNNYDGAMFWLGMGYSDWAEACMLGAYSSVWWQTVVTLGERGKYSKVYLNYHFME